MMVEKAEIPNAPKRPACIDPATTASDLVEEVIAGKKTVFEVRSYLQSIKHPGERLKLQYEFQQQLWSKMGIHHGIDKWGDYVKSLKKLQSQFIPE